MDAAVQEQLSSHLVKLRLGLSMRDREPLKWWHHSSPQSRHATELLSECDEVYCRAANKAGKTQWEYAAGLALLQKRPDLDGVRLPTWRGKIEAVSLEIDHPTQKLSSQKVVLALLGDWPHKPTFKGNEILASVKIKPYGGSDNQATWSELTFQSQENRSSGTGVRADLILANEPPRKDIWEEIRKAGEAGRRILRIIGATPVKRSQWFWLADQYGGNCPRGGYSRVGKWAEIRWGLDDNSALSLAEIRDLKWEYEKNPATYDARVFGDYCNTSGLCPFDEKTLLAMLQDPEWAREPAEISEWRIPRERKDGTAVEDTTVPVEVFGERKNGSTYYLPMDLASGIDDISHDHAGLLVTEFGSGDLMVQYEAAIAPYRIGLLAAGLGRVGYGNALVQFEANKWSMGTFQALMDVNYPNIGGEQRALRPGEWAKEPGFTTDEYTRGAMISAIQAWIEAYRSGIPYARPSRKIIECLLDTVLDEKGKPVAGPGSRDELMILWGQSLRKTVSNRGLAPQRLVQQELDPQARADARLVKMILGKDKPKGPQPKRSPL